MADPISSLVVDAAIAIGRLDGRLVGHPLAKAWRHRARIEAAKRQSAADGHLVDIPRLMAELHGLRLRPYSGGELADRGADVAGRVHAVRVMAYSSGDVPDTEIRVMAEATRALMHDDKDGALLSISRAFFRWIEDGGDRLAIRAVLPEVLQRRKITMSPLPCLSCARASSTEYLHSGPIGQREFFESLRKEAESGWKLLDQMIQVWQRARASVPASRSTSRLGAVVDLLLASALANPSQMAQALGMSRQGIAKLLRQLEDAKIVVEVTNRRRLQLYGLFDQVSVRGQTRGPKREDWRGSRGRPSQKGQQRPPTLSPGDVEALHYPPTPAKDDPPHLDDAALDNLFAEIDLSIARISRVLADRVAPASAKRNETNLADEQGS